MTEVRFSDRVGAQRIQPEISIREGAPERLRNAIIHFALDGGVSPEALRGTILKVLDVPPDPDLLRAEANVVRESQRHLNDAEWFEVYDVVEALWRHLAHYSGAEADNYAIRLNRMMVRLGVAWQIQDGRVETRGAEAFEHSVDVARAILDQRGFTVARSEIHEALSALSLRPRADVTGAVQHAIAALECVAREATGQQTKTLGAILVSRSDLFPAPIGDAVGKLWGFSSEYARHVREGRSLDRPEAELLVGLAASLISYLCTKLE